MPASFLGSNQCRGRDICRPVAVAKPEERVMFAGGSPKRVAIFVEPSPFSHVSGMKNRFECLIKGLREMDTEVTVVTPDPNPPKDFHGAKVVNVLGFRMPFYNAPTLLLSLGLSVRVLYHLVTRRPDVIHVSTPGILVFAAILYSKVLSIPLVVSYHTHVPEYIPKYTWSGLVAPMWSVIRFCSRMADLTLVTSKVMKDELTRNRCQGELIDVWQRGVDTELFNPRFRSDEMRSRMTSGEPDRPLLVYVGRLGAEKNIKALRNVLEQVPDARLAFVGDGPERAELEQHFRGLPVTFMGMLKGEELSAAYASADVFVMPSETETLGFVVLEAMASGLPVVAVRAGGIPDIINQPGTTGYLYEPGDYAQAAALTRALLQDAAMRADVGTAARAEVQRWGWSAATQQLRNAQYTRAIHYRSIRKRIDPKLAGLWVLRQWQAVAGCLVLMCTMLVNSLDYAHKYRTSE